MINRIAKFSCAITLFSLLFLLASGSLLAQEDDVKYKEALHFYAIGKFQTSLNIIRSVFEQVKFRFSLRMLAASNYIALGNYKVATIHLKTIMQKNPNRFEPIVLLSYLLRKQKKYYQAITTASRAIRKIGDTPSLRLEIATTYYHLGNFKKAHQQIQRAIELDSKNYHAYYMDGLTFLREHKYDSAEFRLRNALALNPKNKDDVLAIYNNLGIAIEKKGEQLVKSGKIKSAKSHFVEAEDFYSYALTIAPENTLILANKERMSRR